MKSKIFSLLDVIIVVVFTSIVMYFLGGMLIYRHLGGVNYNLMGGDDNLKEFVNAYNELVDNYYDELDKSQLIDGAIDGMYSKVQDPYTTYMDEYNTTSLNDSLSGEYRGIGIQIEETENGELKIAKVFDDSPAYKSGLQVGDVITNINGEDVTGFAGSSIAEKIKGNNESMVTMTVYRNGENINVEVEVENLLVPVIDAKLLTRNNHNVGYIKLSIFNATADVQFANALTNLENSGMEYLIIDLRDNTGGYLEVTKNIAEMFLEKDKVIYSLENKDKVVSYTDKTNEKRTYQIAVLINKVSASASEILAGALKYSYGASIVGEKSYGKGKVQERSSLSNGTTVKFTTAEWLMPNGVCIDRIGISPDYEVAFDRNVYDSEDIYSDSQILYTLSMLAD